MRGGGGLAGEAPVWGDGRGKLGGMDGGSGRVAHAGQIGGVRELGAQRRQNGRLQESVWIPYA